MMVKGQEQKREEHEEKKGHRWEDHGFSILYPWSSHLWRKYRSEQLATVPHPPRHSNLIEVLQNSDGIFAAGAKQIAGLGSINAAMLS